MSTSVNFQIPSLVQRSTTSSTDSSGCVVCDSDTSCPDCSSGEECLMTIQTCSKCPVKYCKAVSSSSSSSSSGKTNVGAIAGGVVAGVVVLVVGLFLFYKLYYKKKVAFNRVRHKEFYFDDDVEVNFHHMPQGMEKPSTRTSIATTVFTRASNIIPIAYIPGVTIGPQSNNNNNSRSRSRMSTVSEAATVDSELVGDRYSKASIVGNPSLTTTAIRARPKLVTVDGQKNGNGGVNAHGQDGIPATAVSATQLGGVRSVKMDGKNKKKIGLLDDFIEEEEEEEEEDDENGYRDDSDVDSVQIKQEDEGNTMMSNKSYEPFIIDDEGMSDEDEEEEEEDDDDGGSVRSRGSKGSVILEVEMDTKSPFDD